MLDYRFTLRCHLVLNLFNYYTVIYGHLQFLVLRVFATILSLLTTIHITFGAFLYVTNLTSMPPSSPSTPMPKLSSILVFSLFNVTMAENLTTPNLISFAPTMASSSVFLAHIPPNRTAKPSVPSVPPIMLFAHFSFRPLCHHRFGLKLFPLQFFLLTSDLHQPPLSLHLSKPYMAPLLPMTFFEFLAASATLTPLPPHPTNYLLAPPNVSSLVTLLATKDTDVLTLLHDV